MGRCDDDPSSRRLARLIECAGKLYTKLAAVLQGQQRESPILEVDIANAHLFRLHLHPCLVQLARQAGNGGGHPPARQLKQAFLAEQAQRSRAGCEHCAAIFGCPVWMSEMRALEELVPGNINPRERQATTGTFAAALSATVVGVQLKNVSRLTGLDVTCPCHDEFA